MEYVNSWIIQVFVLILYHFKVYALPSVLYIAVLNITVLYNHFLYVPVPISLIHIIIGGNTIKEDEPTGTSYWL